MFWVKRAPWVALLVCVCAVQACAFTFSYGNLFDVKDVSNTEGILALPIAQGKYQNVKILSKSVYLFLRSCKNDCRYELKQTAFACQDYRQTLTLANMLIANVDFNGEIILTCLVFRNKDGFSVKFPEQVVFKDRDLENSIKQYLADLADKTL